MAGGDAIHTRCGLRSAPSAPPSSLSPRRRYAPSQQCQPSERWPGLFEVPVWDLTAQNMSDPQTMDYGDDGVNPVYDILRANFDATYGGNRAPLPIFIHTPWLSLHVADVQRFVGGWVLRCGPFAPAPAWHAWLA